MFKKLHSNRDPEKTLFSEIKREFGQYFNKAEELIVPFVKKHPKPIFNGMVISIFISLILSFTVFRNGHSGDINTTSAPISETDSVPNNISSNGFDQILRAGAGLKETIALKQDIEMIISKKELTADDSIRLEKALERLEQLNKSLK